jgi:hypothetical protein
VGLGSRRNENEGVEIGEAVLADGMRAFREVFGERLIASYALGSLAHGGFCALVSDVDLALVLNDPIQPSDLDVLLTAIDGVRASGSPLHERLSVFWGTPSSLRGDAMGGRFPPLDRLCLLEHGRLLVGEDIRDGLPRPEIAELVVAGARFALDYLSGDDTVAQIRCPELLVSRGVRWLTKIVLFPARFLFTAATGEEGTNDAAATRYLAGGDAPGRELVAAALAWRQTPPGPDTAVALVGHHLVELYVHYLDDYTDRLVRLGQVDLAGAFRAWRRRLRS